jgi:hypothetical protein
MTDTFLTYLSARNLGIVVAIEPGKAGEIRRREHRRGKRRKYPIVLGEFASFTEAHDRVKEVVSAYSGWEIWLIGCPDEDYNARPRTVTQP